jgi:hypothetical protein
MDRRTDAATPFRNLVPVDPSTELGRQVASELAVPLSPLANCDCLVCRAFVSQWAVDQLDEVDELAAGFNHAVGLTIPDWLNRYANDDVEFGVALNGVADVFEILPMLPCPSGTPTRTTADGRAWNTWLRHRP